MPTAAKLVAAAIFAVIGYLFSQEAAPNFINAAPPSYFVWVSIASGIWAGWFLCGKASTSISSGIGNGLTAAVGLGVAALFSLGFVMMIGRSLRKRYDGPFEALIDVVSLMIEHAGYFASPTMIGILVCGGIVGGGITGWVGQRYPN